MKKEPLSTSTQEVPKVKLALQDKYNEEEKKENQKQKDYLKKNPLNYQNQLAGDF